MKAMTDTAADGSAVHTRLGTIRMSELQLRHARASLRDGELIAELVLRAAADMRAIGQGIGHAAASLANGIKAMFAKPVKH